VVFYYNVPDTPSVRRVLGDPARKSRLEQVIAQLSTLCSDLLYHLGRFVIHTEFLANPVSPQPQLWHILGKLHSEVYESAVAYIRGLRAVCSLVSYDQIAKDLLSKSVVPPESTGIVTQSPIRPQHTSDLPTIANFKECLRQLNDLGRSYHGNPNDLSNIETAIATIESLRPSIDEINEKFRTLDDMACQIYGAQSQRDFQVGYENAWKGIAGITGAMQHGAHYFDPGTIAYFVQAMSRSVRALEMLTCEIEGAQPPGPEPASHQPTAPKQQQPWGQNPFRSWT
jgi:hypothetical protein